MVNKHIYSTDGAKIAYDVEGNGSLLVLLHGSGATKEIWEKYGWVDALKNYYKVIAIDIRGYGKSDKSQSSTFYDIKNILNDINLIIKEMGDNGDNQFSIIGHSYGATIGLQCIAARMNLKKIVLAGTILDNQFFENGVPNLIAEYEKMQREKECNTLEVNYDYEDIEWINNTDLKQYIAQFNSWKGWRNMDEKYIDCPVAIYSGTNDNPDILNNLTKEVHNNPNITIKIFDNLDHNELISESNICIPFVLDFLRKV